jgi:hypothetical protein
LDVFGAEKTQGSIALAARTPPQILPRRQKKNPGKAGQVPLPGSVGPKANAS